MKLSPMRYKNYIWPHNPKTFEIRDRRRLAVNPVPFGRWTVTDMGTDVRVLRGEGEFVGEGAYDEFLKLKAVFDEGTPGMLVHPVWQSVRVWFSALSLRQEPLTDFVSYSFEFVEDETGYTQSVKPPASSTSAPSSSKTYKVVSGDCLWSIAKRYGLTLNQIIALNPQIKNPNLIRVGEIINIS